MSKPAKQAPSQDNRCFDESFLANCDKKISELFFLWKKKHRGSRLPGRKDVDPVEILNILPNVMLVDVVQPGPQFIYSLVGAAEKRLRGFDPIGKSVQEAYSGIDGEYCDGNYRYVAASGKHLFDASPEPTVMGRLADAQVLFLPLAKDGETVDTIMVCGVLSLIEGDRLKTTLGKEN